MNLITTKTTIMAVKRFDISKNAQALDKYIEGVWLLKKETQAGQTLNTYDRYVKWHADAMMEMTPLGNSQGRNAAHSGPVFLPWHRMYLNSLEKDLQRVLNDNTFGLPYWNWGEDGMLPTNQQANTNTWMKLGGAGSPVSNGPFKFDINNPNSPDNWIIKVEMLSNTSVVTNSHRGLERILGTQWQDKLPTTPEVKQALSIANYDTPSWDRLSSNSFRNVLEGWTGTTNRLHNGVHVWVGGDMLRGHSPNDPIFFLHHCNVDRIWAFWQLEISTLNNYLPNQTASDTLKWHRKEDIMFPMDNSFPSLKVQDVLDFRQDFEYETYDDLRIIT